MKIIKVSYCRQCPYWQHDERKSNIACSKDYTIEIKDSNIIHLNCPLETYQQNYTKL